MDFLTKIWTFLKSEFDFVFTNVSGVVSTVLSELPDDVIAALHDATNAFADGIKAGNSYEVAITAGLNVLYKDGVTEAHKIAEQFFTAITLTSKPAA